MPRRTALRALILEVGLSLLLVGSIEIAFAAYVRRTPTFPLPRLLLSSIDTGKYLAFRNGEKQSPLDVVFLGISPMMKVSGRHLHDIAAAQWQQPLRSFSFAAPFHSVELDRRLLDSIVFPIEKPAVVVYGVNPINLLGEPAAAQIEASIQNMPAFRLQGGGAPTRLRDLVLRNVALLQYREVLRDLLSKPPAPPDPWIQRARQTDSFGDLPMRDRVAVVRGVARWEQKYAKRFERFDTLLGETLLFEHIRELATLCRQHDVRLVVLLNPVHPFFLDLLPNGQRDYDVFVARLRDTARQADIPFFDPAGGGIGEVDLFQDTHHHNQAGSEWLGEQIARFLIEGGFLASPAARASAQRSTAD